MAETKTEVSRFVYGLRGRRENPVSLAQIRKRFAIPEPLLHSCINDLLTDGAIGIVRNGPRSAHSHRQGFSYIPGDAYTPVSNAAALLARGQEILRSR